MSNIIATDAQTLSIESPLVELFELEIASVKYYFFSEFNLNNAEGEIVFDGNTYTPFPMELSGVEHSADGAQNRPKLMMANVSSLLSSGLLGSDFKMDDLVGGRVTKRTTLEKYTGATTPYEFPKKVYVIDRITAKNNLFVELELASPFDLQNVRIPNRVVVGKYCPWTYKDHVIGEEDERSACYWNSKTTIVDGNGNEYWFFFTKDDEPLVNSTQLSSITDYYKGAYSPSTTYTMGQVVSHSGYYWQAKDSSQVGKEPGETQSLFWQKIRPFTVWSTDSSALSYVNSSIAPEDSSYVYHNDTVWRCAKSHTRSLGVEPGTSTRYWREADICGKLISSCKSRYQAIPYDNLTTGIDTKPNYFKNENKTLPFGGFPGSRKFR